MSLLSLLWLMWQGKPGLIRIAGRLVYNPAQYRTSRAGTNYRDAILHRISFRFCWLVNDNVHDPYDDYGCLRQAWLTRSLYGSATHRYGDTW